MDDIDKLLIAIANDKYKIAERILSIHPELVNAESQGYTPFYVAIATNSLEIVDLLIRKGGDVNMKDVGKRAPLHWAAETGNRDIIRNLSESSASVNSKTKNSGLTPLHLAAHFGNIEAVQILLQYGAKFDIVNRDGETPLD